MSDDDTLPDVDDGVDVDDAPVPQQRAVFVISVAAELAGMHPQTLRIYERKGLIDPYRTPGGTRRYSQDDIDRLALIQDLTEQGLNLAGVQKVMELQEEIARLKGKVEALEDQLDRTRDAAAREARDIHASYRHELMLRSEALPDITRR
ncbi:MAG TPA: helix-turn-helix transcriptional regulator [Acidimicrobiia bacterium]|nr:helix-turn-helix transcriptional regulator [Acidimicrobiia bacterium]